MSPTVEIYIKGDYSVLIDEEDFEEVNKHKWYLIKGRRTHYASTVMKVEGKRVTISLHRFIMKPAQTPHLVVDHINRNGLDNRKSNLRICNRSDNALNSTPRKPRGRNTKARKRNPYWAKGL